ncbi:MAG: YceD family protein [Steroidobacteraceae bacterium]
MLKQGLEALGAFDLARADTYDTRPMSDGRSKLRDVSVLADEGAVLPVEIPVRDLPRLLPELAADSGIVRGELRFVREQGTPAVDASLEATVTLVCQRCMRPMSQQIVTESRVCLPADEEAAARVPADFETMLAPNGRLSLADLVAEDLLLELPLSPRHEDESECDAPAAASLADEAKDEDVPRRPFAGLAELMGREVRPADVSDERPNKTPRTRR